MFIPDAVLDHVQQVSGEPDLSATKYRLLRPLGRGGMAVVYAAEDTELGREVAIKVSTAIGTSELCARLRLEARIIARLEHPGIVPVHDIGLLPDGRLFYVMKLIRGERFDGWVRRAPELRSVLRVFVRVCEAVAFAHAHGVVHRDLKPENVMIGEFGEALVMDWGLAKPLAGPALAAAGVDIVPQGESDIVSDTVPVGATAQGTIMGTAAYMPPEQARGDVGSVDARSDVYALGAVLYFVLTRRPPFDGASVEAILERVVTSNPRPVRDLAPDVPKPLQSICAKAMSRDRALRYASALELADDIGRFLDGSPVRAHRETVFERAARFAARHRVLLSLLGAYLIVRALLAFLVR